MSDECEDELGYAAIDNRIAVTVGSEGCSVDAHTNEMTFDELESRVLGLLKRLSRTKINEPMDVNVR